MDAHPHPALRFWALKTGHPARPCETRLSWDHQRELHDRDDRGDDRDDRLTNRVLEASQSSDLYSIPRA